MAWTATKTFVAGAILTAADMNTYVSDNTDYLKTEVDSHHVLAGSSSTYAKSGGVLYEAQPNVGNVDAGEDTLYTQSIPANVLGNNGESLSWLAWGTMASNTNQKDTRVKYGATTVYTLSTSNTNHNDFYIHGVIVRTGAATQVAVGESGNAPEGISNTSPTETLSGAVTFAVTGEGVASNDIILAGVEMLWRPAGN